MWPGVPQALMLWPGVQQIEVMWPGVPQALGGISGIANGRGAFLPSEPSGAVLLSHPEWLRKGGRWQSGDAPPKPGALPPSSCATVAKLVTPRVSLQTRGVCRGRAGSLEEKHLHLRTAAPPRSVAAVDSRAKCQVPVPRNPQPAGSSLFPRLGSRI